jgi:ATP-dependent Lon protease
MRDFRDAKAMAKTLREALHAKSVTFTNSVSQELVARILGYRDWNVLAARIQATQLSATSVQANTLFQPGGYSHRSYAGHDPVSAHHLADFRGPR